MSKFMKIKSTEPKYKFIIQGFMSIADGLTKILSLGNYRSSFEVDYLIKINKPTNQPQRTQRTQKK